MFKSSQKEALEKAQEGDLESSKKWAFKFTSLSSKELSRLPFVALSKGYYKSCFWSFSNNLENLKEIM